MNLIWIWFAIKRERLEPILYTLLPHGYYVCFVTQKQEAVRLIQYISYLIGIEAEIRGISFSYREQRIRSIHTRIQHPIPGIEVRRDNPRESFVVCLKRVVLLVNNAKSPVLLWKLWSHIVLLLISLKHPYVIVDLWLYQKLLYIRNLNNLIFVIWITWFKLNVWLSQNVFTEKDCPYYMAFGYSVPKGIYTSVGVFYFQIVVLKYIMDQDTRYQICFLRGSSQITTLSLLFLS